MNKSVYLGVTMLQISKTFIFEFWYGYVQNMEKDQSYVT